MTLYSVMLGDRYVTQPPPGGLLFYLKSGHMQGLAALSHEKRGGSMSVVTSYCIRFMDQCMHRSVDCKESPGSLP